MSDVMKKIILYAAVLFSAVSCKVEYGESGYLTSGQLQSYASDIVYVVVEDMRILNLLIDIDEYLSMTQEEQDSYVSSMRTLVGYQLSSTEMIVENDFYNVLFGAG